MEKIRIDEEKKRYQILNIKIKLILERSDSSVFEYS
jgi:hypothetical protein